MEQQLANFAASISRFEISNTDQVVPKNWFEAFQQLISLAEQTDTEKKIIFIDELSWLDTPRSDFITSLEHFWNSWAYHRNDILLIVCGSVASWMISKLINNHGGLHNRLTQRMLIQPFKLSEVEGFLQGKGAVYNRYQLVELYMAIGGIPFYLDQIDVSQSITQNIDRLFFSKQGLLRIEFDNLYRSLFRNADKHIHVIEALAKKAKGLTRDEISKASGISNGGGLTSLLEELEQCAFIREYLPFGKKKRGAVYQLIDPYSLFYLKFIQNKRTVGEGSWLNLFEQATWRSWSGYAFEFVCLNHLDEIKKALGISGVYAEVSSWRSKASDPGAQIDLIIDRRDRVINVCEIKYSQQAFSIDKRYAENLRNKLAAFKQESKTTKAVFLTMISTFGIANRLKHAGLIQQELTLDALFD
jgi:predicted AAA+ superfamily ATPase